MKKISTVLTLLLLSVCSLYAAGDGSSDSGKEVVDLTTVFGSPGSQGGRSLSTSIEAYLYRASGEVEVCLRNIGNAEVRLKDANGNVVDSATTGTDVPVSLYLDTNHQSGAYTIIITSPSWFAEGSFIIQ